MYKTVRDTGVRKQPALRIGARSVLLALPTQALLRWNNAEPGVIAPAQFVPLAGETGLIPPIGK